MNREHFRRPLLFCAVGAYLLYCIVGALAETIPDNSTTSGSPPFKSMIFHLAARMWPYPMVEAVGWRVSSEPWVSWLLADLGGLVLVALAALVFEAILGPERRLEIRFAVPMLIGLAVLLLIAEFTVVAIVRATA